MQFLDYLFDRPARPRARSWLALAVVVAMAAALLAVTPQLAGADSSDFATVDFAASGPDTYDHATGGGFWADNVEQLQGGDFACGEVATYLVQLVNDGSGAGTSDDPESVEIFTRFSAINGGQQGVGHIDVTNVQINTTDPANIDTGTAASVSPTAEFYGNSDSPPVPSSTWTTVPGSYNPTEPYEEYLHFGFQVDGIEAGDTIIVRIDTLLGCDLTKSKVTGTMQGQLESATALRDNAEFAGGRQTIPFISLGEFGFGNPSLAITKTVTDVDDDGDGTSSVDEAGDVITYEIEVDNTGDIPLTGVTVVDPLLERPNGTLTNDANDDGAIDGDTNDDGVLDVDETWTWTGTYTVQQSDLDNNGGGDGDIDNTATASSDQTGDQDAWADVPLVYNPLLSVDKVLDGNADEDGSGTVTVGDTLTYTITASNDGNVTLTNVEVSDDLTGGTTACATVVVGDTCVLTVTYTVTEDDGTVGNIHNVGTADSNETGPEEDPLDVLVVIQGRRSIAVANTLNSYTDGGTVAGSFLITNKSSKSKSVYIDDYYVTVDYRVGREWVEIGTVDCTFIPEAGFIIEGDGTQLVTYECADTDIAAPEGAKAVRTTVHVTIRNQNNEHTHFLNRSSLAL